MSETPFRITLILIAIVVISIMRYFRWRAAQSGERISRQGEGWLLLISIRLFGLAMAVGLLAYLISPSSMAWSSLPLAIWVRWCGLPLAIVSTMLMAWMLWHLDRNLTDTTYVRQNARLVTSGPYAYVRHPMYVGLLLLIVACSLLASNVALLVPGIITVVLLAIRSYEEERQLELRFGDEYRAYRSRTGKFWPKRRA